MEIITFIEKLNIVIYILLKLDATTSWWFLGVCGEHSHHAYLWLKAFLGRLDVMHFSIPDTQELQDPTNSSKFTVWPSLLPNQINCHLLLHVPLSADITTFGYFLLFTHVATWCTMMFRGRDLSVVS